LLELLELLQILDHRDRLPPGRIVVEDVGDLLAFEAAAELLLEPGLFGLLRRALVLGSHVLNGRRARGLCLSAKLLLACFFLTALLLGGGLALMDKRPLLAGVMFGCLIYKPQFALIIPPLLLASKNWRAVLGAAASSGALIGLTLELWGWPVWQAFIDSLPLTRDVVIEQGSTGFHKIMSPFAAIRMWGGPIPLAYAVQAAATAFCIAAVAWIGWFGKSANVRNALVCAAVLVSTPYVLDYDYVVLLPAIAFLWLEAEENGWLDWDKSLLAFVWIVPLAARQIAEFTCLPVGLASAVAILAISLRRAVRSGALVRSAPALA